MLWEMGPKSASGIHVAVLVYTMHTSFRCKPQRKFAKTLTFCTDGKLLPGAARQVSHGFGATREASGVAQFESASFESMICCSSWQTVLFLVAFSAFAS
jgi:hypothetical protein